MTHNHILDRDISEIKRPRSDSSSSFRLVEIEVVRFFETFWTMLKVFERCFPRVSFWEHEFRDSNVCVEYLCCVTNDEINVKPLNFSSKNSLHLSSKCNLRSNSNTFNWSKFRNHLISPFVCICFWSQSFLRIIPLTDFTSIIKFAIFFGHLSSQRNVKLN